MVKPIISADLMNGLILDLIHLTLQVQLMDEKLGRELMIASAKLITFRKRSRRPRSGVMPLMLLNSIKIWVGNHL